MESKITFDLSKLNALVRNVSFSKNVRIGIFGNKSFRKMDAVNNPTLGALHEFGSFEKKIPARSWLRMPLSYKSEAIVKYASVGFKEKLAAGDKDGILNQLGIGAYRVIQYAFGSRGFGTWKKNKPSTVKRKKSSSPLIDTGQLRRSVTWMVK